LHDGGTKKHEDNCNNTTTYVVNNEDDNDNFNGAMKFFVPASLFLFLVKCINPGISQKNNLKYPIINHRVTMTMTMTMTICCVIFRVIWFNKNNCSKALDTSLESVDCENSFLIMQQNKTQDKKR
jgi:hypothetical protein